MRRWSSASTVALIAATTLASCTSANGTGDRGSGTPSSTTTLLPAPSTEPPRIPSATELPGEEVLLEFADEHHAFALLSVCDRPAGPPCAFRIAVLADGGDWELRDTPLPPAGREGAGHSLTVAGPGSARLSAVDPEGGTRSWLTTDGARTWRPAPQEPAAPTGEIPRGAELLLDGPVRVLMPDTAVYRDLAAQPPLIRPGRPQRLADGSHWTAGEDPDTGRVLIARTEDHGRGWRLLGPLPTPSGHGDDVRIRTLVTGPGTLYAFETGALLTDVFTGSSAEALVAIHRSTDDGRTWKRAWSGGGGAAPRSLIGTPIAAADGSLTVYADNGIHTSRDGGGTFEITRPGPPPEEPSLTRAGYLLTDLGLPGHYRISADGFSWHTLILGGDPA
jgi:hypothetical protein